MRVLGLLVLLVAFLAGGVSAQEGPPERIVSLAPSVTEVLFALGVGERVVGVTDFCDRPPEARERPKVGGLVNPSLERILSLRPELVVLGVSANPPWLEERLRDMGLRLYVFRQRRLQGLPQALQRLAQVVGAPREGRRLARSLQKAIEEARRTRAARAKRVLFIVWPEPLVVAGPGSLIDDAIALLGHENIARTALGPFPKFSLEEVLRASPEVILIGGGHVDMQRASRRLLQRLKATPAVKEGKVYFVGDALYRPGPRVVEGLRELRRLLHD
jgi:iron complex transport system substrate-binding protein